MNETLKILNQKLIIWNQRRNAAESEYFTLRDFSIKNKDDSLTNLVENLEDKVKILDKICQDLSIAIDRLKQENGTE